MSPSGTTFSNKPSKSTIRWRGKLFTLTAACALALEEHRRGNFQTAADIYSRVLVRMPDAAEVHNNRGVVLQKLACDQAALASYDRALALKPDYANAHYNRGTILKKLLRLDEALASYHQAVALKPDHVEALNNRGVLLQETKQYDAALADFDQVIALQPTHVEAHSNRGILLLSQGNMAEAEKMFRRVSVLQPDFPDSWFNLANIRNYQTVENAEVQGVLALLEKPGVPSAAREQCLFALGKIYDDCGIYDEAFAYFQQANQIRNAQVAYQPRRIEQLTDDLCRVFSRDFLSGPASSATDDSSPIFIVGMPRSGTTLLASMLSNHPSVGTAGELSALADLTARLPALTGSARPYPAAVRDLTVAARGQVIGDYLQRLRQGQPSAVSFVVDKNPLNFRHLGFIAKLFPRARIIHCTRHPLATCLSNYFQRFPLRLDYSFALENIAHFYREYARLMAHWQQIPTLRQIEVRYEDTILHTEQTARRLLDFMELDWNERCLQTHTNPNVVETASHWQVRQPIYQHSLEHWRHYEKFLTPVKDQLAAAGPGPVIPF
jgi:tetratricopeptide (TPR) repeat protein